MSYPKTDFGELRRRQGIVKTGLSQTPADVDTVKPSLEWNDRSQRYVLVNLANKEQRPKSVYPAFRVLGFFPTIETATEFGRQLASRIPECNIYLLESCKWNLISQSPRITPEENLAKIESLLIAYYKELVLNKLDFDKRRSENTGTIMEQNVFDNPAYPVAVRELEKRGVSLESLTGQLEERQAREKREILSKIQQEKTTEQKEETTTPPPPEQVEFTETLLHADEDSAANSLPPGQRHLLFSVMQDDQEPAFCVYGALPTLQESKGFLHYILKKEAPTHDNNCADMGRWIYPESVKDMDKLGLSTYPLDEQNRIMQWNRESRNRVANMPGTDVYADRAIDSEGNIVDLPTDTKNDAEDGEKKEE